MSVATVVTAVRLLADLAGAAAELASRAQQIGAVINRAQAEGRDKFTDAEWKEITAIDDAARVKLGAAIERAEAKSAPAQG